MNKTLILYVFCADYHEGQNSRLYRLCCMLWKRLQREGYTNRDITSQLQRLERKTKLYKQLEAKYGN